MSRFSTEIFIARKIGLSPAGDGRRSPAVGIAIGGVALAVAVMLITLAVVCGFQNAIRQKVMGFEASMALHPLGQYYAGESEVIELSPILSDVIAKAAPGAKVAPVITQPVVLKTPDSFAGVVLSGFGEGHDFTFENNNILEGAMPSEKNEIAVSALTAHKLGIAVGDKLDGCFFIDGNMKLRRLVVSGIFSSNFSDYDRSTAYARYDMLASLRGLQPGFADRIDIAGIPLDLIPQASQIFQKEAAPLVDAGAINGGGLYLTTLFDTGATYFSWLDLLDTNVIVILVIMSIISGFTLVSCVFILILQRIRMIGLLKSLGATDRAIRTIFMLHGGKVILWGMIIGNAVGLLLILLQGWLHIVPLDPSAYFLSYVPVMLTWKAALLVNVGALLLGFLLMLIPASLISGISPSRAMRYE